jgi:hypothetical protein
MADLTPFMQAAGKAGPGNEHTSNAPTPADLAAILASRTDGAAPVDMRTGRISHPVKSEVDKTNFTPTPSLNPLQLSSLQSVGVSIDTQTRELIYTDDAGAVLRQLGDLLASTHKGLLDLGEFKAAAHSNPEWTEAAAVMKIAEQAERADDTFGKRWAAVERTLRTQVSHFEKELAAPVKAAAERGTIAAELRAHFKGMEPGKRMSELQGAIQRGENDVAAAVLGAPYQLSGLSQQMHSMLTQELNRKQNPSLSTRLAAAEAGLKYMEKAFKLVLSETSRVVGVAPHKLAKLRSARTVAAQKLALLDQSIKFGAGG